MMNLLKLLWWKKPKPEQTDIKPSARYAYQQEIKQLKDRYEGELEWINSDRKLLRCSLDAQIIEMAKLKALTRRISVESHAQAYENQDLKKQIAQKQSRPRKKK